MSTTTTTIPIKIRVLAFCMPLCWVLLLHGIWVEAGWRTCAMFFIVTITQIALLHFVKQAIVLMTTLTVMINNIQQHVQYFNKILGSPNESKESCSKTEG